MALIQFFPFTPDYMSWEDWNGNLLGFYSEEPIPYTSEEGWMIVASNMAQLPIFAKYPIPDPDGYENWQTWANDFTMIVNGPSQ